MRMEEYKRTVNTVLVACETAILFMYNYLLDRKKILWIGGTLNYLKN